MYQSENGTRKHFSLRCKDNLKEKNEAWAAVVAALARVVFEHPGGPCNRTPRTGDIPNLANESACLIGHSTASLSFFCFREQDRSST